MGQGGNDNDNKASQIKENSQDTAKIVNVFQEIAIFSVAIMTVITV
ncbi:MAG: hypothetical protein AB7V56_06600 [Candidatus Nitrosocosmicus sp.]